MKELIYIFLGGGTGSVLRYYVQELLHERIIPYSFPWATFTVNIFGSFLIGLFYALSARFNLSPEMRLLLTAGFCGGFTTFHRTGNRLASVTDAYRQIGSRKEFLLINKIILFG